MMSQHWKEQGTYFAHPRFSAHSKYRYCGKERKKEW
jgi:hypothetical protein